MQWQSWASFIIVCPSFLFIFFIYLVFDLFFFLAKKIAKSDIFLPVHDSQACHYHGKWKNAIVMVGFDMNLLFIVMTFHAQTRFWQQGK